LTKAIVRPPGDSFRRALSTHPDAALIDPERAKAQHLTFRQALVDAGLELVVLPVDERYPDGCFTQDPAVVLDDRVLVANMGAETRRGEAESLRAALRPLVSHIEEMEPPATLEGGDVVLVGRRVFVGRSLRTNDAGFEAMKRFAGPLGYQVRQVQVPEGVLHLGTSIAAISDELVVGRADVLAGPAFSDVEKMAFGTDATGEPEPDGDPDGSRAAAEVDGAERVDLAACNVLAFGRQVIAAGSHRVHLRLEERGFVVNALDLSEFVRADAGPTCLALLVP
jgi:dimethylargininase